MKIPQIKRYSIYKKIVLQDERSKKLNFNSDGREHYVYRVTDYTRNLNKHYYGSRTPPKNKLYKFLEDEFWTYRTSSKYNILNENKKENYKVKILRVFDNPGDKILYESFLHQYFNVKLHNKFWNESNQMPWKFDTTGMKHTELSKEKMRNVVRKTRKTGNVKNSCINTIWIKNELENKQKRVEEKFFKDFQKQGYIKGRLINYTSNLIWIYNINLKKNKRIEKEKLPEFEFQGWLKGRKMKF